MIGKKPKTFADCSIYAKTDEAGYSTERALVSFIMTANRIDISSNAFKGVVEQLKSRSQSAIIVRMLQQGNVVLGMAGKELSPSLKVFYAKDIKSGGKTRKVFVDVSNLIKLENGFFVCTNIDKFAAYLLGVLVMEIYYNDPNKLITNGNLQKASVTGFIKLFNAILNDQRLPGYIANKAKIQYISGVYFGVTVMGLEMSQARAAAAAAMNMNRQDAANADFYYKEEDLKNIYVFLDYLIKTFKLKDLAADGFINKWIYSYGKGTMYALELYPAFLTLVLYAASGSYINNMKRIENTISKELVDIENIVIRVGNDAYSKGFRYESHEDRSIYEKNFHEFYKTRGIDLKSFTENMDTAMNGSENRIAEDTPSVSKQVAMDNSSNNTANTAATQTSAPISAAKQAVGNTSSATSGGMSPSEAQKMLNDTVAAQKESSELDPSQITDDAIKKEEKDTPNNGEIKDLIEDIDKDKPMNEGFLDKFKKPSYNDPLSNAKSQMNNLANSASNDVKSQQDNLAKFKELAAKQKQLAAHENATCDFDAHLISKEMITSELKDQGVKTEEEAKKLQEEIKKDAPMNEGFLDNIRGKKPRRLTYEDITKIDVPQVKKDEKKDKEEKKSVYEGMSMEDYINTRISELVETTKDFDPDEITQDAIDGEKKDTPNNGELDDLKDEIVDDIVLK